MFTIKNEHTPSLFDDNYNMLKDKISTMLDLNKQLPEDIKISTMTLECKFGTQFYPLNIYNYIRKSSDNIVRVAKINIKKKRLRPINDNTKSQIKKDSFLNQVTIYVMVTNKNNPISIKIFNNGSVHLTGCISVDTFLEAMHKLCIECSRSIAVLDADNKIKHISFAETPDILKLNNIYDVKIDMINCIFSVPFKIDRQKLHIQMKKDGYMATYDSNSHAAVNVKITNKTHITAGNITMLIFEPGSIIIILGKQGFDRINETYNFIYKYMLDNYELIVKDDISAWDIINKYL